MPSWGGEAIAAPAGTGNLARMRSMPPSEVTLECLIAGPLKCVGKRQLTKRGVQFWQLKLQRGASSHTLKYTVPALQAAGIEIGRYYRVALLPDCAPEQPPPVPSFNPGDHVLEWWKWAGVKVWRPAIFVGLVARDRGIIRSWSRARPKDRKVKLANLTPTKEPFPALDDLTAILPGDDVLWRGKEVAVDGFVSSDQAIVFWQLFEDGIPLYQSQSKLVPLAQLMPPSFLLAAKAAIHEASRVLALNEAAQAKPAETATPQAPIRRIIPESEIDRYWNRQNLYEEVWTTPLLTLATKYGISDVGLAKTCRKLGIPLPGRDYWAKKAAGQVLDRVPLPTMEDGVLIRKPTRTGPVSKAK
jgi:hypothetical protein